jgi:hypothetical protein
MKRLEWDEIYILTVFFLTAFLIIVAVVQLSDVIIPAACGADMPTIETVLKSELPNTMIIHIQSTEFGVPSETIGGVTAVTIDSKFIYVTMPDQCLMYDRSRYTAPKRIDGRK